MLSQEEADDCLYLSGLTFIIISCFHENNTKNLSKHDQLIKRSNQDRHTVICVRLLSRHFYLTLIPYSISSKRVFET